jgi:uncharacterized protein YbjT (DUF2867 family)
MMTKAPLFVTGGTGAQGGAVIDALLANGASVRALVRDPQSAKARALAARGVELARGDFDDVPSLREALKGVRGAFSMQTPPRDDPESELRAGRNLIDAARAEGVETFVHTSVARAGDEESFAGWAEGRWWRDYWTSKSGVNAMVRAAGFPHWVILKPAYMMANYLPPKAQWMQPGLAQGAELVTAMAPDTRLDLIDPADIGRFAAAAFADPDRFNGQDIDLAADSLTAAQIASAIAVATGKSVAPVHTDPEDAIARGFMPGLVLSEQWCDVEGYKVDIAKAESHGIPLTPFSEYARRHADAFVISHD